mmetsp:Transcript_19575/g.39863  ORF Transcript_19575/g.39863 Transcript_19575/m.39863 type:complete len:490 (-) Transcript_19575:217-1686(-)
MLSSESTPLQAPAADLGEAGRSSAPATSAPKLVGRWVLLTTAWVAALIFGALVLQFTSSGTRLTSVGTVDVGTTFSRTFQSFQCEADEWRHFLEEFSLDDKGTGTILDWPTFRNKGKPCPEHNVLWLWPSDDHNHAFQINKAACYRLLKWSESACSVAVVSTKDVEHAEEYLDRYPDSSLEMVGLGGHGSPESLHWGDCSVGVKRGGTCTTTRKVTVFKSPQSWDTRGSLERGSHVETVGAPVEVEGYVMVSIKQGGAVELSSLNCLSGRTCVLGRDQVSIGFLKKLSRKMYRDSSLLLDSCETAGQPQEGSRNLAKFVSDTVGNGIRVMAADETLYTTDVTRWHPFYANLNKKAPVVNTKGGTCPSWASRSDVDEDGDCKCPGEHRCMSIMVRAKHTQCRMTMDDHLWKSPSSWDKVGKVKKGQIVIAAGLPSMEEGYFMLPIMPKGAVTLSSTTCGKKCPMAFGKSSAKFFLPSCSDDWSSIQCGCR